MVGNILLFGSTGQLGQAIVKVCNKWHINVLCPTRKKSNIDITTFVRLQKDIDLGFENIDVIINCAAYNKVDEAEENWKEAFLVNGVGPQNLAIIANEYNIPIVHFSSDYVFDGTKGSPYTIADQPNPINKYGQSKLLGEQMVRDHTDKFYIIRLSWLFGAGGNNFPNKLLSLAENPPTIINGQYIWLPCTKDEVACPTYTVDVSAATIDLINSGIFGTYHMTNIGSCSRYEWAIKILDYVNHKNRSLITRVNRKHFDTKARRPAYSSMDNFPLDQTLGREMPTWQDATERFLKEIGVAR